MLEALHIQDLAIIDDLSVQFGPGLNILTGETGAGKSILIGAIQLLLGGKAEQDQIRQGAEGAVVEGLFQIPEPPQAEGGLEPVAPEAQGQLLLRRVVSRGGRGRAYVNGQLSTLQMLSDLGRRWVNIYGQHEHQSLLQPERHIDLLDGFGSLRPMRSRWEDLWRAWGRLGGEIREAETRRHELETRRELWEFQCMEIERAHLIPGEDEALELERRALIHSQRIREGLQRSEERLYGESGSALEKVQVAFREMQELARLDPRLAPTADLLADARLRLEEGVEGIRMGIRQAEWDPGRLEEVEDRLAEVQRLKRKYQGGISEILTLAGEVRVRLTELEQGEGSLRALLERRREMEKGLLQLGRELRQARTQRGELLSAGVERELRDLGTEGPVFQVQIAPLEEGERLGEEEAKAGGRGLDRVEFLLSTNLGEPPRPLARIASGGELSRIMLALKKVLAEADRVPTLILDEVDAGIGGAVAQALGEKLAHIARDHQVLCITHLAQIASYAQSHLKVRKVVRGGRSVVGVETLAGEGRVEEISRMLGGRTITQRTRAHARELLRRSTR
jgi:DNA repair protein RecN (Recombination protein N)